MNEREQAAFAAICASKNYREICPETIERVFIQKLGAYKSLKEADKAARSQLHQIAGAFLSPEALIRAQSLADEYAAGREEALDEALLLHASTRERAQDWRALYARAFEAMGYTPGAINDFACGLNPLALGALGIRRIRGWDIQGGAAKVIGRWAEAAKWDIRAECADILTEREYPQAELSLMMKLLPLLERQQAGYAARFMRNCTSRHALVSFPTKTLGGRNVGMAEQYARWMEQNAPDTHREIARYTQGDELVFLFERK